MKKERLDEIRARAEAGITVFGPKGITGKIVHFHQDTRDLLAYVELLKATDCLSDTLLQSNLITMKAQVEILESLKKRIDDLEKALIKPTNCQTCSALIVKVDDNA